MACNIIFTQSNNIERSLRPLFTVYMKSYCLILLSKTSTYFDGIHSVRWEWGIERDRCMKYALCSPLPHHHKYILRAWVNEYIFAYNPTPSVKFLPYSEPESVWHSNCTVYDENYLNVFSWFFGGWLHGTKHNSLSSTFSPCLCVCLWKW